MLCNFSNNTGSSEEVFSNVEPLGLNNDLAWKDINILGTGSLDAMPHCDEKYSQDQRPKRKIKWSNCCVCEYVWYLISYSDHLCNEGLPIPCTKQYLNSL